jgi:hypothetical protein
LHTRRYNRQRGFVECEIIFRCKSDSQLSPSRASYTIVVHSFCLNLGDFTICECVMERNIDSNLRAYIAQSLIHICVHAAVALNTLIRMMGSVFPKHTHILHNACFRNVLSLTRYSRRVPIGFVCAWRRVDVSNRIVNLPCLLLFFPIYCFVIGFSRFHTHTEYIYTLICSSYTIQVKLSQRPRYSLCVDDGILSASNARISRV